VPPPSALALPRTAPPGGTAAARPGSRPRWPCRSARSGRARRRLPGAGGEGGAARQRFGGGLLGVAGSRRWSGTSLARPPDGRPWRRRSGGRGGGLGRLRQRDQQGLLGVGQALRLVAEIGEAGGPHALQVAAVGGQREVEGQDLALGEAGLQLQGAQHLDGLRAHRARARFEQPRGLHGQRRGAGGGVAVDDRRADGAGERDGVDARMEPEPAVLHGDDALEEPRIGAGEVRAQTASAHPPRGARGARRRDGRAPRASRMGAG
jgi:hypothetical protein